MQRGVDARWQLRLEQVVQRAFVLRLQLLERQVVALQEACGIGIEQRRGPALIHQRHRDAEGGVDAAKLSEICELVRPGDVTDSGEDGVLHDRAKQNVRAELCRRLPDAFKERVFRFGRARRPVTR